MEYQKESKICQNCKNQFTVEPEDFKFYAKIKVPPPTFCPECRMIRKMNWRNERTLYKRKCDAPGHTESLISIYSSDSPVKVYDHKYWWSDEFDATEYGREYDFNKPFFEQFYNLLKDVPVNNIITTNNVNCDYTNFTVDNKNCYLLFGIGYSENSFYSNHSWTLKDSSDIYFSDKMELCYENAICQNSYKLLFSQNSENCTNSYFLFNCKNCSNCFGCVGLRNKQYNIFNEQYTKEEYEHKLKELNLGSFVSLSKFKNLFTEFKLKFPNKYMNSLRAYNSTGDNITDAQNVKYSFDCLAGGSENCKFTFWAGAKMKDIYDGTSCGVGGELDYEIVTGALATSRTLFSAAVWGGLDIEYSYNCQSSSKNLFGCVGLKGKQYCILNKQYTKEEYEQLVPKLIDHMNSMPYISEIRDEKGEIKKRIVYKYGEFFPPEISPFSYNETIAQEYFPLTKERAIKQGYRWKDPEERNININLKTEELKDNIQDVDDSILNQIIECAHKGSCNEQCTQAFKIIKPELDFYRKMNLTLPRLCPNCRHYQRIKQRNPLKLWHRKCQCNGAKSENGVYQNTATHQHGDNPCPNEFETTYFPDRPEIIYCEQCYQQEVA